MTGLHGPRNPGRDLFSPPQIFRDPPHESGTHWPRLSFDGVPESTKWLLFEAKRGAGSWAMPENLREAGRPDCARFLQAHRQKSARERCRDAVLKGGDGEPLHIQRHRDPLLAGEFPARRQPPLLYPLSRRTFLGFPPAPAPSRADHSSPPQDDRMRAVIGLLARAGSGEAHLRQLPSPIESPTQRSRGGSHGSPRHGRRG